MAKLILADTQYESVAINTTLNPIAGKQYCIRNIHTANITITYGASTLVLPPNEIGIFVYDGSVWSELTPRAIGGDMVATGLTITDIASFNSIAISLLKPTTIGGNITQTAGTASLKATTINGGLTQVGSVGNIQFSSAGNGIIYTRPDYNYLWTSITGGFVGFVTNGRSTSILSDANLLLKADKTSQFFSTLIVGTVANNGDLLQVGGAASVAGNITQTSGATSLKATTIDGATIGTHKLAVNGTCANTTGVWATLSDIRLKTNFSSITDGLSKVLFLADKVKHFKFKEGINEGLGNRTGIVIDNELVEMFPGHITEVDPSNEYEGKELGWEYADEDYTEEVPVMETKSTTKQEIKQNKKGLDIIVEVVTEEQTPIMKTIKEKTIQDNKIVEVEKQVPLTETVTKTRRIVTKKGSKARQVENSFFQYLFPAIKEIHNENKLLKDRLKIVEAKLSL